MIRLDTLNKTLKDNWESKTKEEKQEFISKFIESVVLIKDKNNNLHLENINFRKSYINNLVKFLEVGIFDVYIPVNIGNKEEYIKGSPNLNETQAKEYIERLKKYYEITVYELYETFDEKTNELMGIVYPKENEKPIRILAFENEIDKKSKYEVIFYNPKKPKEE